MTTPARKFSLPFTALMVLFTIIGIPIIIMTPFFLFGFLGRP